jgi:mannan endo-1,4-beta-mannosidase
VTRNGSQLLLNGNPFRFSGGSWTINDLISQLGANIYWLGLDENVNGIHYPSHFRILDALETAQGMFRLILVP